MAESATIGEIRAVGARLPRNDAAEKAAGAARYLDDIELPGMLHTAFALSPLAHAPDRLGGHGIRARPSGRSCGADRRGPAPARRRGDQGHAVPRPREGPIHGRAGRGGRGGDAGDRRGGGASRRHRVRGASRGAHRGGRARPRRAAGPRRHRHLRGVPPGRARRQRAVPSGDRRRATSMRRGPNAT